MPGSCQIHAKDAGRHHYQHIVTDGSRHFTSRVAYCASKAALNQMTRVMALDWAQYNIRVNAIGPGPIRTPFTTEAVAQGAMPVSEEMVPLGRWGEPDEIVAAALYLASEASSFVTGAFLLVDGGQSIKWS
jgi:NAD(P)-dependent dehydrogenase (short-subunit alcohol dehydrogenase family)